jgi:hypothetical protein
MAHIRYEADGDISPERFIAALTDFSDARPSLWPNLSPRQYAVHDRGDTWADVTEGSDVPGLGGVWAHERYDWSMPGLVQLTLIDAPDFVPGSVITYRVTPRASGGCHVAVDFQRIARTPKGRLVGVLVQLGGSRQFTAQLRTTLARLAALRVTPKG